MTRTKHIAGAKTTIKTITMQMTMKLIKIIQNLPLPMRGPQGEGVGGGELLGNVDWSHGPNE